MDLSTNRFKLRNKKELNDIFNYKEKTEKNVLHSNKSPDYSHLEDRILSVRIRRALAIQQKEAAVKFKPKDSSVENEQADFTPEVKSCINNFDPSQNESSVDFLSVDTVKEEADRWLPRRNKEEIIEYLTKARPTVESNNPPSSTSKKYEAHVVKKETWSPVVISKNEIQYPSLPRSAHNIVNRYNNRVCFYTIL